MFNPKSYRIGSSLKRVAAPLIAAATGLCVAATPAMAGTNGQQLYFTTAGQYCGPLTGVVTVTGHNQANQLSTWTGYSSNGQSVFTAGWWWQGPVTIRFGNRTVPAYVPQVHDITDGPAADRITATCFGTRYYPTWYRFNKLGGKMYYLLNNSRAWDPMFRKYLYRNYVFGYWAGHYVYKITNSVGIDINTGQVVIAESTNHLIILAGAVAGARACNPPGMNWTGFVWVRSVVTSWCGAGGAIGAYVG